MKQRLEPGLVVVGVYLYSDGFRHMRIQVCVTETWQYIFFLAYPYKKFERIQHTEIYLLGLT